MYYNKCGEAKMIFEKISDIKHWIGAYRLKYNNYSTIIVGVYRSPRSQEAEFCDKFEEIVEELIESNKDIVIVGGFNIDCSRESVYKRKIECIINDNGLQQLIKYTRVTKDSKTVIDYVITNIKNITSNISSTNKISDHEVI